MKLKKQGKLMRIFTDHPASVGESYSEHLVFANSFGFKMILGGIACCLHGIFPWMFKCKGSQTVQELHETLQVCRGSTLKERKPS